MNFKEINTVSLRDFEKEADDILRDAIPGIDNYAIEVAHAIKRWVAIEIKHKLKEN